MESTKTVEELLIKLYGRDFADAFDKIDLTVVTENESKTVDELARRSLEPEVVEAIQRVDLKAEAFAIRIVTSKLYFELQLSGRWLLLFLLTIAAHTVGFEQVQAWIEIIFNAQ